MHKSNILTVVMATYREFDLLWATLAGLRANHQVPFDIVVQDNSPELDPRARSSTLAVGGRYFHRPDLTGTSASRDSAIRFARTPWVLCIDAHILFEEGAIRRLIEYLETRAQPNEIITGPLINDDGRVGGTHWKQNHPPGLWGVWDVDPRLADPDGEPGEIPMQGLGVFCVNREFWPGFNPLNRGFGGEEGIIHETYRQLGGKAVCLPSLRWRHKFRDISGWDKNPVPYPLHLEDHVWNLLVGHRELGIEAKEQIHAEYGKRLAGDNWNKLVAVSEALQPWGSRVQRPRKKLLGLWYSDNSAPRSLLQHSLVSVLKARGETLKHAVTIAGCVWEPIPGFEGFGLSLFEGVKTRSHSAILSQIEQAYRKATANGEEFDGVCLLEHDVLYPENYFDRVGDALALNPNAPVVSNRDYIGLNGTGWLKTKVYDHPLHQLTLRPEKFLSNLERAREEAGKGGQVYLEPDRGGDTSTWVELNATGSMPAVHVNHTARFTNHGEVCYEAQGYTATHSHWGEAKNWWPGAITVAAPAPAPVVKSGCGACAAKANPQHTSPAKWADANKTHPSDFHEHVDTLRELASKCHSAAELSWWPKPADAGMVAGLPTDGKFTSVCRYRKPQWTMLNSWMGDRFSGQETDPHTATLPPVDLLFVDTEHTAEALYPLLKKHHAQVGKYIAVHCTDTFGEWGDVEGKPGVMHALRQFCHEHQSEWVVKRRDRNNHGLMILSRCPEDVKELPGLWRKAMNYGAAMKKHLANGRKTVSLEVLEQRQQECAVCPERALDACAACGCPLESKLSLASEQCGLVKKGLKPKWEAVT